MFGDLQTFHYPNWIIDSVDKNPIYWSSDDEDRYKGFPHAMYLWNQNPASFEKETAIRFADRKPEHPVLFIRDLLSAAFVPNQGLYKNHAFNASLDFKSCLFRTQDIPPVGLTQDQTDFAKPIHCFEWKYRRIYDHSKEVWTSPLEMDAFCSIPLQK